MLFDKIKANTHRFKVVLYLFSYSMRTSGIWDTKAMHFISDFSKSKVCPLRSLQFVMIWLLVLHEALVNLGWVTKQSLRLGYWAIWFNCKTNNLFHWVRNRFTFAWIPELLANSRARKIIQRHCFSNSLLAGKLVTTSLPAKYGHLETFENLTRGLLRSPDN